MYDLPEALEQLSSRVDALERRVHALESPTEATQTPTLQPQIMAAPARSVEGAAIAQATRWSSVLGLAMLGIAGAYALRALMESGAAPRLAVAAIAIAYALAWLVWAARVTATSQSASAIYAGTSAMILGPMLWELNLRFDAISPTTSAAVLCGFVIVASTLSWKRAGGPVLWVALAGASGTAMALSIATHSMMPFLAALLLMVLLCEYLATRDQGQAIRALVTIVADVAVWSLIFVYNGPSSARADYPHLVTMLLVAPACLLFLLNAGSTAMRTALLHRRIGVFETVQSMIAFLLAASSLLFFVPETGGLVLGIACLILSASCYTAAFVLFQVATDRRNFRVFAAWSGGLLLAGLLWTLPLQWAAACLGLAALLATVVGVRLECLTLDFHGVVYLSAAAIASGMPEYVLRAFTGMLPGWPAWSILLIGASATLCYIFGKERPGEAWRQQILHLVPALTAVCTAAALLVQGLMGILAQFVTLGDFHAAFIRTLALCFLALSLAFGGALWQRMEMTRIAYAALAFMAVKLFFDDLRYGHMEFIAGAIFVFAVTLIAVPRLARMGHKH